MSSKMSQKELSGWNPYVEVYDPLKAGSIDGTDSVPHDNAIVRAMSAKYKPPDKQVVTSDPSLTLFVGRLNLRTSEHQLSEEFCKYGKVRSCRLVRDIVTGISRGYGFVEFKREADAQKAWKQAHGTNFHDRQILVEWEFSRTMPGWIPRRLGGGLGGRKESGQLRFGGRDRPFKKPFILPPGQDNAVQSTYSNILPDSSMKAKHGLSSKEDTLLEPSMCSKDKFHTMNHSKYTSEGSRRKYRRYPEDKYPDRFRLEDYGRKSRRETDDNYPEEQYSEHHWKKYRRWDEDDSTGQFYHEEDRKRRRHEEDESLEYGYGEKRKYKRWYEDCIDADRKNYRKPTEEKRTSKSRGRDYNKRYEGRRDHENDTEKYEPTNSNHHYTGEDDQRDTDRTTSIEKRVPESKILEGEEKSEFRRPPVDEFKEERKHKRGHSSDSSSSRSSSHTKKHKKSKQKKKKHKRDSSEHDTSSRSRNPKMHKKKKKKEKKKSKRNQSSDDEED